MNSKKGNACDFKTNFPNLMTKMWNMIAHKELGNLSTYIILNPIHFHDWFVPGVSLFSRMTSVNIFSVGL